MTGIGRLYLMLSATVAATALLTIPLTAQILAPGHEPVPGEAKANTGGPSSVIIGIARRRYETSIAAPVAISAISGFELQRRAINSGDSLARLIPTLITSEATSSSEGGIVAIRGLF